MCPIFNVFDCTMTYLSDCILSVNLSSNHLNRMSIYNFFLVVVDNSYPFMISNNETFNSIYQVFNFRK